MLAPPFRGRVSTSSKRSTSLSPLYHGDVSTPATSEPTWSPATQSRWRGQVQHTTPMRLFAGWPPASGSRTFSRDRTSRRRNSRTHHEASTLPSHHRFSVRARERPHRLAIERSVAPTSDPHTDTITTLSPEGHACSPPPRPRLYHSPAITRPLSVTCTEPRHPPFRQLLVVSSAPGGP